MGASRLQQVAHTLQIPVAYFFDDLPNSPDHPVVQIEATPVDYLSDLLTNADALSLAKAFMSIKDAKIRRRIVNLIEEIVADDQLDLGSRHVRY